MKLRIHRDMVNSILSMFSATCYTAIICLSLLAVYDVDKGDSPSWVYTICCGLSFIFVAVCNFIDIFMNKDRAIQYARFGGGLANLVLGIVEFFLPLSGLEFCIFGGTYCIILLLERGVIFFRTKTRRARLPHFLLALIDLVLAIASFGLIADPNIKSILFLIVYLFLFIALYQVIAFAFGRIKPKVILKIMKKTFAFEILFGLFLMVTSFGLIFYYIEPGIKDYGDGLWYCFSIVTTIGFGDRAAKTVPGRILTVILGIYGVVVVALITSIIVNFYNEVSSEESKKREKELAEAKALEETKEKEEKATEKPATIEEEKKIETVESQEK